MQSTFLRLAPVVVAAVVAGCGGGTPPATAAKPLSQGERLYVQNCIACHQRNGEGIPGVQPALAGTVVTVGDPEALLAWVMYGTRPETLPKGAYRGVMPQYAYLSDADLAALLTHVRTSFGNSASPIAPDLVATVRTARGK